MKNTLIGKRGFYSAPQFFTNGSGIATLCGSTRFEKEAFEAHRKLTLLNWAVFMCGFWVHGMHRDLEFTEPEMAAVKHLHFHKILESNVVVIVSDATGYTGDSTKEELAFCKVRNIPVYYFDGEVFSGFNWCNIEDRFCDTSLIDPFRKQHAENLARADARLQNQV